MDLTIRGCAEVVAFCEKCTWPGHCIQCPFKNTLMQLATGQLSVGSPNAKPPIKNAWRLA